MTTRSGFPLADELEGRFAAGVGTAWSDDEFESLALRAFQLQFESVPVYRAYCETRGCTPERLGGWRDVPAVPVTAFKHIDLCVAEQPELVFRTSGTTRGAALRGKHLVARASLYRSSLLPSFAEHLLTCGERMRFLSLVPSPAELPDSSLSFMVGAAADAFATDTSWLVDGSGEMDEEGLHSTLHEASGSGVPALVLTTSLALAHVVERLESDGTPPLPEGSRLMETGGFKGREREVGRTDLHARVEATLGIPSARIVGEYGMTELLSQLYEPVLSEGLAAAGVYVPPPWLKVRALDPTSLEEVPPGHEGLLCFFDLANAGSICHVLTEDVGTVVGDRVRLHGRVRGAEPRGCSRAMDDLMTAAGAGR